MIPHPKRVKKARQRLTAEQQAEADAKLLADLNGRFPIGAVVWYWVTLPFGPVKETKIQNRFFMLPRDLSNGGLPVTFVAGRRGYVSAWHITEVNEDQRPHLDIEIIHADGEGGGR